MGKSLRDKIEQPSFGYSILRITANITFRLFYKKIYVYGKKNIPSGHPVIFAPNHQNAVMDPLAILFTQKNYIVFLARSDVFNGKFLIRLLTFLKILPIYRQRDGIENLAKNEEIFDITVRILKKKRKYA